MKQFFYIVFGGLALVIVGLFCVRVGVAVKSLKPVQVAKPVEEEDKVNTTYYLWSEATTTIGAKAYMVMNVDDGSTLVSKAGDTLMPVASLTKLVTAIIAKQYLDGETRITISQKTLDTYGNSAGFVNGEVFTADDLLYPLLMVSSNDAAEALAAAYGRKEFIKAMNDFTQSIGAYHTYFADPAGLSAGSVSTAHDLAIILKWIYTNQPGLLDITTEKIKIMRSHTWVNPTHFLSWSYYLGGKNGYTPEANRTGASIFKFGSTTPAYAVVVLGSQSRDSDVVSLVQQIRKENDK